ncbi:MAG TPA: TlpA disulfide reductase family protein, partial [Candidatus Polarisedimenticolia bacterium]|nr:TlpA disulfide reductase family protein [Candidatus Polarisedimenticolia bacterium]
MYNSDLSVTREVSALPGLILMCCLSCAPPPDHAAEEYRALQEEAVEQLRVWGTDEKVQPDPRPAWADRLEAFARAHADSSHAAEALDGAMQLRAARQDSVGFFKAYALLLEIAPDSPQVARCFPSITSMRMVEIGGYGAATLADRIERLRLQRRAAPAIEKDLERALAATSNAETKAAAHFAIGQTYHEIGYGLAKALVHFKAAADLRPSTPMAEAAADFARQIEALAVGRPAPDFAAIARDGTRVDLKAFRGRIILMTFWATWCEPCLDLMTDLKRIARRYQRDGVMLVGVLIDADT